jgi:hydrogenase expression/formation protein HypE
MGRTDIILLDHGSGGRISNRLIANTMLPAFDNAILSKLGDGAICDMAGIRIALSTDSYVVDPIFFPGGNIGELAINGTVNDIAMCGGDPKYLSVGLIMEEGFPIADLTKIVDAMGVAAVKAGVQVVTGDTKVVPKGAVDKIFINTSGIGMIPAGVDIAADNARSGDKIILSGSIADHGMTILTQREGLTFDASVLSDTAPLNHMVKCMLDVCPDIHVLRDPTRGGVATVLNEIADQSKVGIQIFEANIPIKNEVNGICEFLGFDPLYVANEGKLIAFVGPEHAEAVLSIVKEDQYGKDACIIGEVVVDHPGQVILKTRIGGSRAVSMLAGGQLPRIC